LDPISAKIERKLNVPHAKCTESLEPFSKAVFGEEIPPEYPIPL
jgi:hypothetical protein